MIIFCLPVILVCLSTLSASFLQTEVDWTSLMFFMLIFAHSWSPMNLNPVTYQPHSNFQQGAAMFTASWVQFWLEVLDCDRSILVDVTTNKLLKCLTETKVQILYDHVDHTHFTLLGWDVKWFFFCLPTMLDQQCSSVWPKPLISRLVNTTVIFRKPWKIL